MKTRKKPLADVQVAVTRARFQASEFAARLKAWGACVRLCPAIRIVPPRNPAPLDCALRNIGFYDWLIFTSINGAEKFFARARRKRRGRLPGSVKVCAIGPATAKALRRQGYPVHCVSKEYVAESILNAIPHVKGKNILIPRAAVARDVLPRELRRRGARVNVVEAYRTVKDLQGLKNLRGWLARGQINCVAFTSSSTVKNFFAVLSAKNRKMVQKNLIAASIGPITTRTLLDFHWPPQIVARKPTTEYLSRAIADFYKRNNNRRE